MSKKISYNSFYVKDNPAAKSMFKTRKAYFTARLVTHLSRAQLKSNFGNKQVTDMENLQYLPQQVNTVHNSQGFHTLINENVQKANSHKT